MKLNFYRNKKLNLLLCIGFSIFIFCLRFGVPPLSKYYSSSRVVYDRNGELLRLSLASDDRFRLWVPMSEISPHVIEAALLKEDKHFYHHLGVNPVSLSRAIFSTYFTNGRRIGGSTLTMQLAKMMYGIQSNSVPGKAMQILRALQLEFFHSKREILEAYLNLIPLGANIEGVGAASLIYFHRPASKVTVPEAIALLEFPQNPNVRSFSSHSEFKLPVLSVNRWHSYHPEDQSLKRDTQISVHGFPLDELPFRAPHFAEKVLRLKPNLTSLHSSLDLRHQRLVERQLHNYLNSVKNKGVKNASAMMVDTRTMEVLASVGSADYFSDEISGQVNGTEAKRSPGSALKPFVYGLAIDQGLIHPMTMLKDAPTSFGSFDPENFDRDYVGPLSAKDALIRSRNIPAVHLFSKLRGYSLYQLLSDGGVTRMRGEKYYGYALPLGGSEVTMEELTALYSIFLNQGDYQALSFFPKEPKEKSKSLLSPEAAYLVYEMLTQNLRPEQSYRNTWIKNPIPVAWKTGTSHGFRDAWSVGLVGPYAIAVWLGNFDGEANQNFIGRDLAGPLFFRIVDALAETLSNAQDNFSIALDQPSGVKTLSVCALTGQMPGKYCNAKIHTHTIPGKSPIKICDVHRAVQVSKKTGLRTCDQKKTPQTSEQIFEVWPSDLLKLFKKAGLPRKALPPFEASCSLAKREESSLQVKPPLITSPKGELTYLIRFGDRAPASSVNTLPLNATADGTVSKLHWFMNDTYLGRSNRDQPMMWAMRPGEYKVRVVDDQGHSDSRRFKVEISE